MTTDTMAMLGVFVAMNEMTGRKPAAVVPEPEFTRFKFPERRAAAPRAEEVAAANEPAANERAA